MKTMHRSFALLCLFAILNACATIAPGNDPVLVNAQRTARTAHTSFDFLFKIERDNDALVRQNIPAVHTAVNELRRKAPKAEADLWGAIEAYRTNRTADNKANLNTYLAVIQNLLDVAASYTQQIQTKAKKKG